MSYADSTLYNLFHFEWKCSPYQKILLHIFIQLAIKITMITSIVTTMSWAWIYIIINNSVKYKEIYDHRHLFNKKEHYFFFFLKKGKFISDCGMDMFSLDLYWITYSFYSLPFLPSFNSSLYMIPTILEANQKYTEEESPNFILESGQFQGGGGLCTESGRKSRSLLGWEGGKVI